MIMDKSKKPGIEIAQICLEGVSFSHRADYLRLPAKTTVDVGDVDVHFEVGLAEDEDRGVARVRVSTKAKNNPVYNFDITIVGLFKVDEHAPNMTLREFFPISFATLFPFVRQAVADLTMRGRFGPVWIHPLNLIAIAKKTKAKLAKKKSTKRSAARPKKARTKKLAN